MLPLLAACCDCLLRLPAATACCDCLLRLLAAAAQQEPDNQTLTGGSEDAVVRDFPDLTIDDVRACLAFAAERKRHALRRWSPASRRRCACWRTSSSTMLGGGPILIAGSEASESITRIHERVFTSAYSRCRILQCCILEVNHAEPQLFLPFCDPSLTRLWWSDWT